MYFLCHLLSVPVTHKHTAFVTFAGGLDSHCFQNKKEGTFTGNTIALNLCGNVAHDTLWNRY